MRKVETLCIYCLVIMLGWTLSSPVLAGSQEADLRAAFVFNFIKFIDWPIEKKNEPFHFCVLGASEQIYQAMRNIRGKLIKNRLIEVRYLNNHVLESTQLSSCEILYRPLGNAGSVPELLPPGVVFVADEPGIHESNVSIALWKQANERIAFSVNMKAIEQAGVSISSQLLKLAQVRNGGGE